MILILGGTTEGRAAVRVADEGTASYYYSTKSAGQELVCKNGIRLTGGMNTGEMEAFCREKEIRLLVDAAHPFAELLHATVAKVAARLNLPVIRYERKYPPRDPSIIWCENYPDAIRQLKAHNVHRLLALTGVQTIDKLKPFWENHLSWFRVLDREESVLHAQRQGFPQERIIASSPAESPAVWIKQLHPDAILTKESGESGYFNTKTEAARKAAIPVFAVKRPALSDIFIPVYGENGLRKEIERLLPHFFRLRSGYTTGVCATVASKAALQAWLTEKEQVACSISLPDGEEVTLPVSQTTIVRDTGSAKVYATACTVIKDAGDDPDATNGCSVIATLRIRKRENAVQPPVILKGGEGIGTVTLPGLGLEVGSPAINTTPRRMIEHELTSLFRSDKEIMEVTLSVPGGEKIALRTFNPKLGIVGGISIIGTSGIVRPFSSDAFVASIRKEIEVAAANGISHLVINSGAKSERYIKACYPELPAQAFVHYGNFIGETVKIAADLHISRVTLGIMVGKAVKLAEGFLDTHSKKVTMNKAFLQRVAVQSGCTPESVQIIEKITLARELWVLFSKEDKKKFFSSLIHLCYLRTAPLLPHGKLSVLLIDEEGRIFN